MPIFRVMLASTVIEYHDVTVRADSPDDAERQALKDVTHCQDPFRSVHVDDAVMTCDELCPAGFEAR